uniref:Uncharacterized protein n=1 Tax=Rhizophagus irregularis (strain DAOM 181602 / DAOM 197198 / MUCL 43194) TaxID=747089 RepID=U9SXS2_RHIID
MALSVKKPLAYVILIIVYLLCLSMTTVCLAFAVKKRNAFIENEINFKSEMIEILYLLTIIVTIVSVGVSMCCSLTSNEPNILGDGGTALVQLIIAIIWMILPAAYTVLTINELENYDFSCTKSSHVCTIRRNNFIFMWINSGIMLLSTFTLCFCYYGMEIQEEEIIGIPLSTNTESIQEEIIGIPLSANTELSTPPVLKRLGPYFCN